MKKYLAAIVILIALFAWAFPRYLSPGARHHRAASALVNSIRADEIAHRSFIYTARRDRMGGYYSERELQCLEKLDVDAFNGVLARRYAAQLSLPDIRAAQVFFDSPTGSRYVRYLLQQTARTNPDLLIAVDSQPVELSDDEYALAEAFAREHPQPPVHHPYAVFVAPETAEAQRELVRNWTNRCTKTKPPSDSQTTGTQSDAEAATPPSG